MRRAPLVSWELDTISLFHLMMRLDTAERRSFYEHLAVTGRWSSRELDKQINSMLYERTLLSSQPANLTPALPDLSRPPAPSDEIFRDPYLLDFLGLTDAYSERDLEAALVANMGLYAQTAGNFVARVQSLLPSHSRR